MFKIAALRRVVPAIAARGHAARPRAPAHAQDDWPRQPVRIVVPWPPAASPTSSAGSFPQR